MEQKGNGNKNSSSRTSESDMKEEVRRGLEGRRGNITE